MAMISGDGPHHFGIQQISDAAGVAQQDVALKQFRLITVFDDEFFDSGQFYPKRPCIRSGLLPRPMPESNASRQ
jgi:hypothetical protein